MSNRVTRAAVALMLLLCLVGPLGSSAEATGTGAFSAHPTTPSFGTGNSLDVALGDLDGDGDLDALVANFNGQAETVWLNNGLGTFTAHPTTPSFGAGNSTAVALGDLDGDGDLDAVVANHSAQAETVWLNNGSGTFTAHPATPSFGAGDSTAVALGDLDRDGDLDAVVANYSGQAETVWLNNGSGSFTAHPATPSFGAGDSFGVALGDLDGDGDLDAVVANYLGEAETVWLNNGLGVFTAHPVTPSFGAGDSEAVALGDLDGDGDLDAVVANYSGQAETVWLNDGSGSFTAHPATSFGAGSSQAVALGDLDRDGDLDAVVANFGEPETVWLNNGSGSFTAHPATPSFGAGDSTGVALGDLDRDGDLDAVVANYSNQAETVWLNANAARSTTGQMRAHPTTPSFGTGNSLDVALGDLDGDGDLDALVANFNGQAETVWLNNGLGTFTAHPTTPSFGAGNSTAVALGDLDGDGDLDAVVANHSAQAETVWLNNGSGTFTAHPATPSFGAGDSTAVALGDLDRDGDLDAVVANYSGQAETVWLNNGSGSFTAHPATPSFGAGDSFGVALGDLDGDGDLDAVVANYLGEAETVWLNNGLGVFTAHPVTPSFGAGDSEAVALGDLDGDGDLDAVVANYSGQAETVWLNDGSGSFTAHPAPSFGAGSSQAVALGDLDRDGDLDAVVANFGEPETVWLNNGSGSFTAHPATPSFGAGDSTGVALGDLDRDGDLDAVVANYSNQAETVWLQVNADPTGPSCTYTRVNANPKRVDFTVSDGGSGLWKIQVTTAVNILPPTIPSFTAGSTSPVSFSAVKDNQALSSQVAVVLTDVQGNQASCI